MTQRPADAGLWSSVDPARVVVSCVFEDRDPYREETLLLYRSLAMFGGALTSVRRIAYAVGSVAPDTLSRLTELSVEVVHIEAFDRRSPHANKLAMFAPVPNTDVIVGLDTDTIVLRDLTPWLSIVAVSAKPVDANPLMTPTWQQLWRVLDVEETSQRHHAHFERQHLTCDYYNTGVVTVPTQGAAMLVAAQADKVRALLDGGYDRIDGLSDAARYYTDQYAFAAALQHTKLPHTALPLSLNFPTKQPIDPRWDPHLVDPFIVHHHHRRAHDGRVHLTGYPLVDAALKQLNRQLFPRRLWAPRRR